MQQPYVTYLLTNRQHDLFYAGTTRDLEFAVASHRQGMADIFTRSNHIDQLVWYREDYDLIEALRHKSHLGDLPTHAKTVLVEQENPDWNDLMPPAKEAMIA